MNFNFTVSLNRPRPRPVHRPVAFPLLALASALSSCGGGGGAGSPDAPVTTAFDRATLLHTAATVVITPTLAEFASRSAALLAAIDGGCASGGGGLADAQAAFRAAASTWQRAELMRIGPARMDGGALRDRINSWPVVSSCAVDQEVMARHQNPETYDLSTKLTNRRGLPALEYLLFHADLASTCATPPAGWTALPEDTRRAARCGFARVAASDLHAQATALHGAWTTGGYAELLADAGESGSPFRSAHEAVNLLSDALFAVDSDVKDRKLGRPAGITPGSCPTLGVPCPQDAEAQWSGDAREHVVDNLRGLQLLFLGGDGVGFDDFLVAQGAPDLAAQLTADIAAALAAVEAIPPPLVVAVVDHPGEVRAAYDAVKKVTDAMKSRFLTVLALELPEDLGDDTD